MNIPVTWPEPNVSATIPAIQSPEARFKGKRTAMVVYSSYPSDPRPRRVIDALLDEGMEIDLICEGDSALPNYENRGSLTITRIPVSRCRGGALRYIYQYSLFIFCSALLVARRMLRKQYDLIYVHNMPDVLVATGLLPKLFGAKVILDQHDPMPELMMTIFGKSRASLAVRAIEKMEKWSLNRADQVITVNEACRKLFAARSCPLEKIGVVMNTPDEKLFTYRAAKSYDIPPANAPFVIMFHGGLVERNGLDLIVEALDILQERIPSVELRIYGSSTPYLEQVLSHAKSCGLQEKIRYFGPQRVEDLAQAIAAADIGVIPNQRNAFTEINTPTRIFEYLTLGKPVIAPRTSGIKDYFDEESLLFFEPGDAADLAAKVLYAFSSRTEIINSAERGQAVYERYTWLQERENLLHLVENCLDK